MDTWYTGQSKTIPLGTRGEFSDNETKIEKETTPGILLGHGLYRELLMWPLEVVKSLHKGPRKDLRLCRGS